MSCTTMQRSTSTIEGSSFTTKLLNMLSTKPTGYRNMAYLLSKLTSPEQSPQVYSSVDNLPLLPYWLGPSSNVKMKYHDGTIVISPQS